MKDEDQLGELTYVKNPQYIRDHAKERENDTCKILIKDKAKTVTICKLDEGIGCLIPIAVIDVSEYNSGSFCNTDLFVVEVE